MKYTDSSKKYRLVKDDFILHEGRKLYRIKALKKFKANRVTHTPIDIGELGGYVEGYHNLSQEGTCWIFDDSKVYGNARVKDGATLVGNSEVYGNAEIKGDAIIYKRSVIYGNARIVDIAFISDDTKVYGNAVISGHIYIKGCSKAWDNSLISNVDNLKSDAISVKLSGNAVVRSKSAVKFSAITDNSSVIDAEVITSNIYGNVDISDRAVIRYYSQLKGNLKITDTLQNLLDVSDVPPPF